MPVVEAGLLAHCTRRRLVYAELASRLPEIRHPSRHFFPTDTDGFASFASLTIAPRWRTPCSAWVPPRTSREVTRKR